MFELLLENANGNTVNLDDGVKYVITDITGLNPPSASLFTSKSPNRKGVKYNGSSLNERNIIISVKLLGDIEANRNALYEWIDTENYVKVRYRNSIKNVYCEGHIEECEFNPFTEDERIDLAIVCEDPYWKELEAIAIEISTLLKQFTFPFAIDEVGVPISTIKDNNSTQVYNSGNETGFKMKIKCLGDVTNLIILNPNNSTENFTLHTTLLEGWLVEIDTDSSPKTVKAFKPDGSVENLLKYTGKNTTWFTLKKGVNSFGYKADTNLSNIEVSIEFTKKHLGV